MWFLFCRYSSGDGFSDLLSSDNEEYINSCREQEGLTIKDIQKRRLINFNQCLDSLRCSYTLRLYNTIVFPFMFGSGKSGGVWSDYFEAILDGDKRVIILKKPIKKC